MDKKDYEIVRTEILYKGFFRLVRLHIRHRLYKNGWSEVFTREILERKPAVAVLPFDPNLDHVILIEQFRAGTINDHGSPWQIEIPAGIIENADNPIKVAKRETLEETGCSISAIEPIYDYFVSPGGSSEFISIYCGKVDAKNVNGIHGVKEEHEDIRVLNLPINDAFSKLHKHEIKNAPAILALQWLEINRENVRKKWL